MKMNMRNLTLWLVAHSVLIVCPAAAFSQNLDELKEEWQRGQYQKVLPQLLAYAKTLQDQPMPEVDYMIGSSWCKLGDPRGSNYLHWALDNEQGLRELPIYDQHLVDGCGSGVLEPTRASKSGGSGVTGKADRNSAGATKNSTRGWVLLELTILRGAWRYTMSSDAGGGTHTGSVILSQVGNHVSGTMDIEGRRQPINGTSSENSIELERDTGRDTIQKYSLTRSGNVLSGEFRNFGKYADSGSIKFERVVEAP